MGGTPSISPVPIIIKGVRAVRFEQFSERFFNFYRSYDNFCKLLYPPLNEVCSRHGSPLFSVRQNISSSTVYLPIFGKVFLVSQVLFKFL